MGLKIQNGRFRNKKDTAANWAQNDIPIFDGEIIATVTDDGHTRLKVGDGNRRYSELPYLDEPVYKALDEHRHEGMVTEAGLEAWLDAEDVRRTDELDRRAAEALRITAEAARLDAEADRASLYATVKEAYDSGELDGESGSITLLDMVIEPPLTQPYFEEAEDSTEARRVYTPHFPTGAVMYASLHINAQDRTLYMRAPAPYVGPTFRLNHTTRNLEVVLNANE